MICVGFSLLLKPFILPTTVFHFSELITRVEDSRYFSENRHKLARLRTEAYRVVCLKGYSGESHTKRNREG